MENTKSVVAIFRRHQDADIALKTLTSADFDMRNLSVAGKGCDTNENVGGYSSLSDRMKFWGGRGAFWGGLWGLFLGGILLSVPAVGHVFVLGYLAATAVPAIEGAVIVGGLSALGVALYSLGIPKNSIIEYKTAIKSDGFLVMVRGTARDMSRAKTLLFTINPLRVDEHTISMVNGPENPVRRAS